jgi:hypothetical protein
MGPKAIVSKRSNSPYPSGRRADWIKVKKRRHLSWRRYGVSLEIVLPVLGLVAVSFAGFGEGRRNKHSLRWLGGKSNALIDQTYARRHRI